MKRTNRYRRGRFTGLRGRSRSVETYAKIIRIKSERSADGADSE